VCGAAVRVWYVGAFVRECVCVGARVGACVRVCVFVCGAAVRVWYVGAFVTESVCVG